MKTFRLPNLKIIFISYERLFCTNTLNLFNGVIYFMFIKNSFLELHIYIFSYFRDLLMTCVIKNKYSNHICRNEK